MQTETERHFKSDVIKGFTDTKRENGYEPRRFWQMVNKHGIVEAARQLLRPTNGTSEGLTKLSEYRRLDISVEAWSLLPWYRGFFCDELLESARQRLKAHDFDVDKFLEAAARNPPAWTLGPAEPSDGS
jgi:hypothetical protein